MYSSRFTGSQQAFDVDACNNKPGLGKKCERWSDTCGATYKTTVYSEIATDSVQKKLVATFDALAGAYNNNLLTQAKVASFNLFDQNVVITGTTSSAGTFSSSHASGADAANLWLLDALTTVKTANPNSLLTVVPTVIYYLGNWAYQVSVSLQIKNGGNIIFDELWNAIEVIQTCKPNGTNNSSSNGYNIVATSIVFDTNAV